MCTYMCVLDLSNSSKSFPFFRFLQQFSLFVFLFNSNQGLQLRLRPYLPVPSPAKSQTEDVYFKASDPTIQIGVEVPNPCHGV